MNQFVKDSTLTPAVPMTVAQPSSTVAAAGSVIGNAAALSYGANSVTGADDTKGVLLPVCAPGVLVTVYGVGATNGLKVYPQVNSTINGGSANSSVTIEGKTLAVFVGDTSTNWGAIYTANS